MSRREYFFLCTTNYTANRAMKKEIALRGRSENVQRVLFKFYSDF
jgi:hypothetical protein